LEQRTKHNGLQQILTCSIAINNRFIAVVAYMHAANASLNQAHAMLPNANGKTRSYKDEAKSSVI